MNRVTAMHSEQLKSQIRKLAFNTARHAVEATAMFNNQVIMANESNSTSYTKAAEKAVKDVVEPYRESLNFITNKPEELESGLERYPIVGFVPRMFDKIRSPKLQEDKVVDTEAPADVIKARKVPLLVIVTFSVEEFSNFKY